MKLVTVALVAALAGGLAGCKSTPETPPAPPPPTAAQLDAMRQAYQAISPTTRIGVVTAVTDGLVMVGDMKLDGLTKGQIVSIIDSAQNAIAHGQIEEIVDGKAVLRIQDGATRAPQVGDAAIRF